MTTNLELNTTVATLILMFQFVKDTIKWALQTPTHYIQYHYLSNNNGACTRASPEHGSKRTDKSKFQINK